MKIQIEIGMDSASFDENPAVELARILRDLGNEIRRGSLSETLDIGPDGNGHKTLRDANGNAVGSFQLLEANS
jgi:hypothetical protein